MPLPGSLGRLALAATLVASAVTPACVRRDVAQLEPTTKLAYGNIVPQPAVDKIDLLLVVDNSGSMADKQRILANAVPDLVRGIVQPKCVDKKTRAEIGVRADPTKPEKDQCPAGTEPAFTPITDMHIGVVSSSLGGFGAVSSRNGAAVCGDGHRNDRGRLVARDEKGAPIPEAGSLGFLAWYPKVERNEDKERHPDPPVPAIGSIDALGNAFRSMVVGVGQDGCGFEAQLEAMYRFLAQPDPWSEIAVEGNKASYGPKTQVDTELLRQRAAFLRPDSLVAVVMLTDEDDSSPDPLAISGSGYVFNQDDPMPRATSACATDPASKECTSCEFAPGDPACANKLYTAQEDNTNVRYVNMKKRFGVDPQFPIQRYVDALTANKVPARASEHEGGRYVGKADCTNPLFAAELPTEPNDNLCKLRLGPRSKDLVLFALIGGVPNTLLPTDDKELDWTKILGRAPERWDTDGIDAHMLQSTKPRPGLPGVTAANDADPVHGREWTTNDGDLQYACTFPLVEIGADGKPKPVARPCTGDPNLCDCNGKTDSPVCDPTNKSLQVRGKAYPTRRQLMVAKELGSRAVVASLCPRQLDAPDKDDYGYRPAATRIVDRLARSLVGSCLPRPLVRDGGEVPCLVLAQLAKSGTEADCAKAGLKAPSEAVLAQYRERRLAEDEEDVSKFPVCEVPVVDAPPGETCKDDEGLGFCAVDGVPGLACANALVFTKGMSKFSGARFSIQCVQVAGAQ